MFPDAYGQEPKEVKLCAILDAIRDGKYEAEIRRARELYAKWKEVCPTLDSKESPEAKAYDSFKKTLPAFCISGTAKSRTQPLEHSGLLQVDCDKLGGELDALREKLKADKHVAFVFISPSGEGLKVGLAIDGTRHAESFEAARRYFRDQYEVEIDPSVKDRLRLCFVSHDPDLCTRADAIRLPIPESEIAPQAPLNASGPLRAIVLPGGGVTISGSARDIFQRIGPTETLFWRGGTIVEMMEQDGVASLVPLMPEAFRSRVERHGQLFAWRSDGQGDAVLKPIKMPRDDATAIMNTIEARELLPPVASVLRCLVLVETSESEVTILGRGYHRELGGLLVVAGDVPPRVELPEAVESLKWLVGEFHFQSEGDRSRAWAGFITPALRLGGFFNGSTDHVPIDVAEADQSQSGKGYRHGLICALYNESGYFVTARNGGVGSMDESFAAALIAGRPFVCLDNLRGKLDSQHLESFLTCPGIFPARVPFHPEVMLNPKRFLLQMSSNGLEATRDLVNRASICRIRKRPNYNYRDTLGELQRRQPYFLGCVFSVIREWIAQGKPRTNDTTHSFTRWNQTLDWIVQNIFGGAPLMDGHGAAQERVSNPALSWLRKVGLAVEGDNKLGVAMPASEIVELCQLHDLDIPGGADSDQKRAALQVGTLMRRIFKDSDKIAIDEYAVCRTQAEYHKPSGDKDFRHEYTFSKSKSTTQPPRTTQAL